MCTIMFYLVVWFCSMLWLENRNLETSSLIIANLKILIIFEENLFFFGSWLLWFYLWISIINRRDYFVTIICSYNLIFGSAQMYLYIDFTRFFYFFVVWKFSRYNSTHNIFFLRETLWKSKGLSTLNWTNKWVWS